MQIETREEEGIQVVTLDGKLTIGDGDVALRDEVVRLIEAGHRYILLDLHGVRAIDSSGLGELIRCRATAERANASIKLLHVEDKVEEILEMTRLIGVFDNYNDESDAFAAFRKEMAV